MELSLNVWKRGSQRAVNKPLFLLYDLKEVHRDLDIHVETTKLSKTMVLKINSIKINLTKLIEHMCSK